jgi:hypothetical protein
MATMDRLRSVSDEVLLGRFGALVKEERRVSAELLRAVDAIDRRQRCSPRPKRRRPPRPKNPAPPACRAACRAAPADSRGAPHDGPVEHGGRDVLLRGEVPRSEATRISGLRDRAAREVLSKLTGCWVGGVSRTQGSGAAAQLRSAAETLFPRLDGLALGAALVADSAVE